MEQFDMKHNEMVGTFFIVPAVFLNTLAEDQKKIITILLENKSSEQTIGNYIPESDAKKRLNRKTTWFWNMRNQGKLAYTKVGSQIFYKVDDIEALLNNQRKEAYK